MVKDNKTYTVKADGPWSDKRVCLEPGNCVAIHGVSASVFMSKKQARSLLKGLERILSISNRKIG